MCAKPRQSAGGHRSGAGAVIVVPVMALHRAAQQPVQRSGWQDGPKQQPARAVQAQQTQFAQLQRAQAVQIRLKPGRRPVVPTQRLVGVQPLQQQQAAAHAAEQLARALVWLA